MPASAGFFINGGKPNDEITRMDDPGVDTVFAGILAGIAGVWTAVTMFFNLKSRVDVHDREINTLKATADQRFNEIREDIQAVSDRTEQRHNSIEGKIDRLIERVR